jgi:hypothetical protein
MIDVSKPYDVIEDLGHCPECGATQELFNALDLAHKSLQSLAKRCPVGVWEEGDEHALICIQKAAHGIKGEA